MPEDLPRRPSSLGALRAGRPRTTHQFVGHVNPRCTVCGRTPMEAQRHPQAVCERPRPLFDQVAAAATS